MQYYGLLMMRLRYHVDPELAQFDYLPVPNSAEARWHSIPPNGGGIDRSDSEQAG